MTGPLYSLEQLGIAAAYVDGEWRIVGANKCLATVLQRSVSSLSGESLLDALAARATDRIEAEGSGTYRIEDRAGAPWYRVDLKTECGSRLALLTDVTGERRAVESLRDLYSTRDRLLLDGKIGTWRYDPAAEVYYFSTELSLGHEGAGAPVPVALLQRIQHPDDRDTDTAIRERITREGGNAEAEIRYREANGNWTHLRVHYRAGRRTAAGLHEMFGISQNITPVAQARDEANQLSQRLSFALRAAQAGVFEYSHARGAFWISPELAEMIGGEAVLGEERDPLAMFVPADRDCVRQYFAAAGRGGQTGSIDARIVRPGGQRWVRFYFDVTRRNGEGKPESGVGLLLDIDERKQWEIALADAQRTAEFANRTKTEFLANMSHELRTPLNAILGFSELTANQIFGPLNAKYVDYARDIHRSGAHLLELVNDVLDLAKLEAGKLELRESAIALPALVEECFALVRARADGGGVKLVAEIAADLPLLRADERSVRQLLLNFLSNAVKFTPAGGKVTVWADWRADSGIRLSVADTGVGMSAQEVKIALAPFGQVDSKLARNNEGTGLGLPICKSLIELHGGEMSVASEPNKGTTLTVRFPATRTIRVAVKAVA